MSGGVLAFSSNAAKISLQLPLYPSATSLTTLRPPHFSVFEFPPKRRIRLG
jgi:hypothetical protein